MAAYERFARGPGRSMPSAPRFNSAWGQKDHPIVNVTWNDAKAFCEWSGGRLPTEAEWEYAARSGREGTKYPWGDAISHEQANYGQEVCCGGLASGRDRWEYTSPVGSFDANGFGLHDMIGNVWEWCADVYDGAYYGRSAGTDPRNDSGGSARVVRGGSWVNYPRVLRASNRGWLERGVRGADYGLRCARDVSP